METDVYVSSLCNVKITEERRSGNTTRIINNVIELLFNGHTVNIEDHINNNKINHKKFLLRLIKERLLRELSLTEEKIDQVISGENILISLKFYTKENPRL